MAEFDDDEILLMAATACTAYHILRKRKRKRISRYWIHPVITNRDAQGDYGHLISELRTDPALFRRYFRVTAEQFDDLLYQIQDRIQLQNTKFRNSIDPGQQLAICLR